MQIPRRFAIASLATERRGAPPEYPVALLEEAAERLEILPHIAARGCAGATVRHVERLTQPRRIEVAQACDPVVYPFEEC